MALSDSPFLSLALCGHVLFNGVIATEDLCVSVCFLFSPSRALHFVQYGKQFERNAKQVKNVSGLCLNRQLRKNPGLSN